MAGYQTTTIQIHFKRSIIFAPLRNLFLPKDKKQPRVVTFTGFSSYKLMDTGLLVTWGNARYFYPLSNISCVKFN